MPRICLVLQALKMTVPAFAGTVGEERSGGGDSRSFRPLLRLLPKAYFFFAAFLVVFLAAFFAVGMLTGSA